MSKARQPDASKKDVTPTPEVNSTPWTPPLYVVALTLAFIIAMIYLPTVGADFHFDDHHTITDNPALTNWKNLIEIWSDSKYDSILPANRSYRPLLFTNFFFCWQIGGGASWPFHIVKMFTFLGFCFGIFFMWRRLFALKGWLPKKLLDVRLPYTNKVITLGPDAVAFLAAGLTAAHPACTECVTYVSASSSLQCAAFYVAAFCGYLAWRDNGKKWVLGAALMAYAAAVFTKEEGITLPALILFCEIFRGQDIPLLSYRKLRKIVTVLTPFAALALVLGYIEYQMLPASNAESRGAVTRAAYFMTQLRAYLWYMRIWFWPWDLNADNIVFGFSSAVTEAKVIQAIIGNAVLVAFAWFNRRRFPSLAFGLLWFYIAIAPASSIIPLAEPVNERRMFLSYAGFGGGVLPLVLLALTQAFAFAKEARRQTSMLGATLAVILLSLIFGASVRSRVWLNAESLWQDTLEKNPESGRAMNNLALVYMHDAKMEKALELLQGCERVWSRYAYCRINKGITLSALNRDPEARSAYLEAIELNANNADAHFYFGQFLEKVKDTKTAIAEYTKADDLTGGINVEAKIRVATIAFDEHDLKRAKDVAQSALSVSPRDPRALELLHKIQTAETIGH